MPENKIPPYLLTRGEKNCLEWILNVHEGPIHCSPITGGRKRAQRALTFLYSISPSGQIYGLQGRSAQPWISLWSMAKCLSFLVFLNPPFSQQNLHVQSTKEEKEGIEKPQSKWGRVNRTQQCAWPTPPKFKGSQKPLRISLGKTRNKRNKIMHFFT